MGISHTVDAAARLSVVDVEKVPMGSYRWPCIQSQPQGSRSDRNTLQFRASSRSCRGLRAPNIPDPPANGQHDNFGGACGMIASTSAPPTLLLRHA